MVHFERVARVATRFRVPRPAPETSMTDASDAPAATSFAASIGLPTDDAPIRWGIERCARALSDGTISSVELTAAFLQRLDVVQPRLVPMTHVFHESALKDAADADARRAAGETRSRFDGVPLTVKEIFDIQGMATTMGVEAFTDHSAEQDAQVVQQSKDAGAVVLGRTNTSQLCMYIESDNPLFGRSLNPHNAARTPGGSSGGEAVAIATCGSPGGWGTDVGGSVRIPAHYCGIASLKPTAGRLSTMGMAHPRGGVQFVPATAGPMARSVADLRALLEMAPSDVAARVDPAVVPFRIDDGRNVDIKTLRVGMYVDDGMVSPSAAVLRAVDEAAAQLEALGVEVVQFGPPAVREVFESFLGLMSADGGRAIEAMFGRGTMTPSIAALRTLNRMPGPARFAAASALLLAGEHTMAGALKAMGARTVADYWDLVEKATLYRQEVMSAWNRAGLDAVLCPVSPTPALPHGMSRDFIAGASMALRYNFLNLPTGVLPWTSVKSREALRPAPYGQLERMAARIDAGSAGLPVGVQLVARPFKEDHVLALMAALEPYAQPPMIGA